MGRFASKSHEGEMEFELNLAPIIDCLTVLIAFTLISSTFLAVSILDAGVAATSSDPSSPPPVNITVELNQTGTMDVRVTGQATRSNRIPATVTDKGSGYDYEALGRELGELKKSWPVVDALTLQAEGDVDYKAIVKGMEKARESFPVVMLGGF
jgi:biopolymer transport protein ExbD